jgi:pyruvate/2-oxoglutarate/acetoin dehydrogenase E1 component
VISRVLQAAFSALKAPPRLLAAPDVPVPFAPELESHYRPNADKILSTIENILTTNH